MSVESVTIVKALLDTQSEAQELHVQLYPDVPMEMEAAVALGVQTVKMQAKARATRIKEVRTRLAAGTYRQVSMVIAQKMLEIE